MQLVTKFKRQVKAAEARLAEARAKDPGMEPRPAIRRKMVAEIRGAEGRVAWLNRGRSRAERLAERRAADYREIDRLDRVDALLDGWLAEARTELAEAPDARHRVPAERKVAELETAIDQLQDGGWGWMGEHGPQYAQPLWKALESVGVDWRKLRPLRYYRQRVAKAEKELRALGRKYLADN